MSIESGPNRTQSEIDPSAVAFADQGNAALRDTRKPDDMHRDDEKGDAVRAERDRLLAADAKRKKRNKVGGVVLASVVGLGSAFGIGKAVSGGESDPGPGPTPPLNSAPANPGLETEPTPTNVDSEPQPTSIENLSIPRDAREWVDNYGSRYPVPNVLSTYYSDKGHEDIFGYSSVIPDEWSETYKPSTNPDQGQLAGLRQLEMPVGEDITNPDNLVAYLNNGATSAIESYLNLQARNPQAYAQIRNEFEILVGDTSDPTDVQRLLGRLDSILVEQGSNAVFSVKPFEKTTLSSDQLLDTDPSTIRVIDNEAFHSVVSAFDENNQPQGYQFVANLAIEVVKYDEEGSAVSSTLRDDVLFSATRSATDNYSSTTVYLGEGDRIGNYEQ